MQRGLPELRDEDRFGPWVYRVARSAIVDHHRRAVRNPVADGDPSEPEVAAPDDDEEGAAERDLAAYVAVFVSLLPSPYREALTLTSSRDSRRKMPRQCSVFLSRA